MTDYIILLPIAIPFVAGVLALLIAFPAISLWLGSQM